VLSSSVKLLVAGSTMQEPGNGIGYKLRSNGTGYKLHSNGTGYKLRSSSKFQLPQSSTSYSLRVVRARYPVSLKF
jgi:hypothetical protein